MQENSHQSKTKFMLVVICVLLFSIAMLVTSIFQIVKINKLNNTVARQERQIDELKKQMEEK